MIVKRLGKREKFDERKIYASVYAACASAHYPEKKCEKIADDITKKVKKFLSSKQNIKSDVIRKKISDDLKKINGELAFYYEEHLPNLKKL